MIKSIRVSLYCSALAFTAATATPALAAECDAVLIPTTYAMALDQEQELALATLVSSEQEYNQAKDAGANGSYGLFSAGGSYSEMQTKRDKILQEQKLHLSQSEAQRIVTSYLPEALADKWVNCQLSAAGGVRLRTSNITPYASTVVVSWRPLSGVPVARLGNVDVRGSNQTSAIVRSQLPKEWTSPTDVTIILDRVPATDLRLVIGIETKSDSMFVPAAHPPIPSPGEVWGAASIAASNPNLSIIALTGYFDRGFGINNVIDNENNRALHLAAERCGEQVVKWLVEQGADPNIVNRYPNTPLQIADARCGANSPTAAALTFHR